MRRWHTVLAVGATVALAVSFCGQALRSGIPARTVDPAPEATAPEAVLAETTHDFGILDPSQPCRHLFIVRNQGTAPLKIAKAGTSCQCTVSVLPKGDIPPGMGGPVEIESKIDQAEGPFRHTAAFATNDPRRPRFELTIEGNVRRYLAASPPEIDFSELQRGRPAQAATIVYSQVWEAFALRDVQVSMPGLTWHIEPAPPEKLSELHARSGHVLTLRLSAEGASKSLSGWVEAAAEPEGQTRAARALRLPVSGRVPPVRSVYGKQVDREGVVTFGSLARGEGARAQLLLVVRGEHRQIRVERIDKTPAFLNVSVEPQGPGLEKKGLYQMLIEVPANAPMCNHMSEDSMGEIRVHTDHPEMPEIVRLKVAFAVLDR